MYRQARRSLELNPALQSHTAKRTAASDLSHCATGTGNHDSKSDKTHIWSMTEMDLLWNTGARFTKNLKIYLKIILSPVVRLS